MELRAIWGKTLVFRKNGRIDKTRVILPQISRYSTNGGGGEGGGSTLSFDLVL